MELKNNRKIIMIVPVLIVLAVIVGNVYSLIQIANFSLNSVDKLIIVINTIFAIFALVLAGLYLLTEFHKKSSKYFKFYLYLYILTEIFFILSITIGSLIKGFIPSSYLDIAIGVIIFLILNSLLFKKNLGKNLSLGLSYAALVSNLMSFVVSLQNTSVDVVYSIRLRALAGVCLAVVLVIMQHLKYYDKAQRDTN